MHIRGGDVVDGSDIKVWEKRGRPEKSELNGHLAQPPCAFYEHVLLRGNANGSFTSARIVTADWKNVCVGFLKKKYPWILVQMSTLLNDVCTIIRATNLAIGIGTFASTVSTLNVGLRRLYGWYNGRQKALDPLPFTGEPLPYEQHRLTTPGYKLQG